MENLFIKASRLKLRFATNKGLVTVEDLWDLNLNSLDNLYTAIKKERKDTEVEGLISRKNKTESVDEIKLSIIEYIFKEREKQEEERKERVNARIAKQARLDKLLEIANSKDTEELKNKSAEEINAMIQELSSELRD